MPTAFRQRPFPLAFKLRPFFLCTKTWLAQPKPKNTRLRRTAALHLACSAILYRNTCHTCIRHRCSSSSCSLACSARQRSTLLSVLPLVRSHSRLRRSRTGGRACGLQAATQKIKNQMIIGTRSSHGRMSKPHFKFIPFSIPLRNGKSTLNKTPSGGWKVYLQRHILCISSSTFILIPLSVPLLLVCKFFAERGRKVKFRPLFCLFITFFWPSPFVSGHSDAKVICWTCVT